MAKPKLVKLQNLGTMEFTSSSKSCRKWANVDINNLIKCWVAIGIGAPEFGIYRDNQFLNTEPRVFIEFADQQKRSQLRQYKLPEPWKRNTDSFWAEHPFGPHEENLRWIEERAIELTRALRSPN